MAELLSRLSAIYRRAIGQENVAATRLQRCAPSKASVAEAMPDADVSRFCGGRSTSSMRRPSDVSSKASAAGLRVIARPLKASSPCQQHIAHRESSHADNSSNRRTGSASMEGPTAASAAAGPTPASSAAVTVSTRATVSRPVASKSAAVCAPQALVLQQLQQLQQPLSLLEAKVQQESILLAAALRNARTGDCPLAELALALGAAVAPLNSRVVLRKITDTKQYWSKASCNAFLVCVLPGARGAVTALLVDPGFKQNFSVAHMSQRYCAIWDSLPDVFVGQVSQLVRLVRLLCAELVLNFESQGAVLPPWRTYTTYISRWVSKHVTDSIVHLSASDTRGLATQAGSNARVDCGVAGVGRGVGVATPAWLQPLPCANGSAFEPQACCGSATTATGTAHHSSPVAGAAAPFALSHVATGWAAAGRGRRDACAPKPLVTIFGFEVQAAPRPYN